MNTYQRETASLKMIELGLDKGEIKATLCINVNLDANDRKS